MLVAVRWFVRPATTRTVRAGRTVAGMWRVISSNDPGRWVQCDDDGAITSAPQSLARHVFCDGSPVELAPLSGEFYTPSGPGDPVAVFLSACRQVATRVRVEGRQPAGVPARKFVGADLPNVTV